MAGRENLREYEVAGLWMLSPLLRKAAPPFVRTDAPLTKTPFSRRNVGKLIIDLRAELPDHTVAIPSKGRASVMEVAVSDLPIRPVIHFQIALASVLVL